MKSELVPEGTDVAQVLHGLEGDFLRRAMEQLLHRLTEAEVTARVGAGLHERSADRATWRNGYRPRGWDTRLGSLLLQIPTLREGSYFPGFLEPRKRSTRPIARCDSAAARATRGCRGPRRNL